MFTKRCRDLTTKAALLQFVASTTVAAACLCTYIPATLVEVLDGNTIILEVEGKAKKVHLAGIDIPKLNQLITEAWCEAEGLKAQEAIEYVSTLLNNAKEISLTEETGTDSDEIVAVVYVDNVSLGQELLYKYLAVDFEPTHLTWCG